MFCGGTLKANLQVEGKKQFPVEAFYSIFQKDHCSCSPRPRTMGALFDLLREPSLPVV